jgi:hypothetical protein
MACNAVLESDRAGRISIGESSAGLRANRINKTWLMPLNEYRADLIHHRAEKPDGRLEHHYLAKSHAYSLCVFAPAAFTKRLKIGRPDGQPTSVMDAIEWLIGQACINGVDLGLSMWSDAQDDASRLGTSARWSALATALVVIASPDYLTMRCTRQASYGQLAALAFM